LHSQRISLHGNFVDFQFLFLDLLVRDQALLGEFDALLEVLELGLVVQVRLGEFNLDIFQFEREFRFFQSVQFQPGERYVSLQLDEFALEVR
jgi:hypothetical protein